MSLPGFNNPAQSPQSKGSSEKPRSDVYTMMLLIGLLAVLAGIFLLCSEMSKYNWDFKANNVPRPKAMLPASGTPGMAVLPLASTNPTV